MAGTKNPFGKSRPQTAPYAIYRAGNMFWHVCKTYKAPENEAKDTYARWFVWAKSPMTYGSFEGGDTYANEVRGYGSLVAADPEWLAAYAFPGWTLPTPAEYLADMEA
jgi:hypothetical protein